MACNICNYITITCMVAGMDLKDYEGNMTLVYKFQHSVPYLTESSLYCDSHNRAGPNLNKLTNMCIANDKSWPKNAS